MGSYQLVLEPEAIGDIQRAINYYQELYENLGVKFARAIEATLMQIQQNPFYQIKYNSIRCLQIKRFPYSIHYIIDREYEEIHILAIIYTASNPDKTWLWQEE